MSDGGDRPPSDALRVYDRHGADWAALRGDRPAEGPWLDQFCALLPPGGSVLDLGCGSGLPIAGALARRGFAVTGVDGSATMLTLFRRNLPDVSAVLADMRALDLPGRFAGLLAWDSFFHLPPEDQRPMFVRFDALAAPDAILMFTSGTGEGSALGEFGGEPLYHGSLGLDEYRRLLAGIGFAVVDHAVSDAACGGRTVWLAKRNRADRAGSAPT